MGAGALEEDKHSLGSPKEKRIDAVMLCFQRSHSSPL